MIAVLMLAAGCSTAPHAFVRRGEIRLSFAEAKAVALKDDIGGCQDGYEHCTRYELQATPPGCRCFSIAEIYFEGGRYYLIDARTGRRTDLPFRAEFSPDGQRILILNDDVTGDFPGELIEIWRRQDDTAVKEWSINPTLSEMAPPLMKMTGWDGDTITVHMSTSDFLDRQHRLHPAEEWDGTLRRAADGWHAELEQPKPR